MKNFSLTFLDEIENVFRVWFWNSHFSSDFTVSNGFRFSPELENKYLHSRLNRRTESLPFSPWIHRLQCETRALYTPQHDGFTFRQLLEKTELLYGLYYSADFYLNQKIQLIFTFQTGFVTGWSHVARLIRYVDGIKNIFRRVDWNLR